MDGLPRVRLHITAVRSNRCYTGRVLPQWQRQGEIRAMAPPHYAGRQARTMSKQRQSPAVGLTADQNKLVEHMAPLVKRIAYHFMVRLPASVQVDDLIQAGLLGLQDAAKNFDDTQGAQFETYAIQRIRGSMLDELRQADWLPRNVRKNLRRIEAAISTLEQRLGRPPREQELADALSVSLEEY